MIDLEQIKNELAPHYSIGEVLGQGGMAIVLQAIQHGNDHRTHICTILGHNGLTYGDLDVWAYGQANGGMTPIKAT